MVATWLLSSGKADEVWLVPAGRHAFGKSLAPFADRVAMARAAIAPLGEKVRVEEVEGEREGTSYTIDTVEILRARHPDVRFSLVVGTDILVERPKWKEFDRLLTLVDLITVRRAGVAGSEKDDPRNPSPLFPEVSSTEIRARLAEGKSVEDLVPRAVLDEIDARHLYRTA